MAPDPAPVRSGGVVSPAVASSTVAAVAMVAAVSAVVLVLVPVTAPGAPVGAVAVSVLRGRWEDRRQQPRRLERRASRLLRWAERRPLGSRGLRWLWLLLGLLRRLGLGLLGRLGRRQRAALSPGQRPGQNPADRRGPDDADRECGRRRPDDADR